MRKYYSTLPLLNDGLVDRVLDEKEVNSTVASVAAHTVYVHAPMRACRGCMYDITTHFEHVCVCLQVRERRVHIHSRVGGYVSFVSACESEVCECARS